MCVASLGDSRKIHVCTVCPRSDADVIPVNDMVTQVCQDSSADLIDCYQSFVFGDGSAVKMLFGKDGIHLGLQGSSQLVSTINKATPIIKERNVHQYPDRASHSDNIRRPAWNFSSVTGSGYSQHPDRASHSGNFIRQEGNFSSVTGRGYSQHPNRASHSGNFRRPAENYVTVTGRDFPNGIMECVVGVVIVD